VDPTPSRNLVMKLLDARPGIKRGPYDFVRELARSAIAKIHRKYRSPGVTFAESTNLVSRPAAYM
jgi:hypothetical protein